MPKKKKILHNMAQKCYSVAPAAREREQGREREKPSTRK